MFGNNYLEEFKNASMQLNDAKNFWTSAIIKMDPLARKLIISQYQDFIFFLDEELENYKRQQEPRMGLPLKLPPDLQKKANTLEALRSALTTIKQAINDEDYEGQNYLRYPIPADLNNFYEKRLNQLREDFPSIPTFEDEDEDEDDDEDEDEDNYFELTWSIKEFEELLNKGFELGSKNFFLVKKIGIFLLVRDTDFNEIKNRNNQFLIYADGFNAEKLEDLVDTQPKKYQTEYDSLRSKSDEFYEGDVCEWFSISEELLNDVKDQSKLGFMKIKLKIEPLKFDAKQFSVEEIYTLNNGGPLCHDYAIKFGGACPISPFRPKIRFSYLDRSGKEHISKLNDINNDFYQHITPKKAKKIIDNYINDPKEEITKSFSEKKIEGKENISKKEISKATPPFSKTLSKLNEIMKKPSNSWDSFYSEFEGRFNEEESLGIELIDSDESRNLLKKLGYIKSSSKELDCTKIGEYFPTCSDDFKELTIIVFHKLPLDFDFDEGDDFIKKWFGIYKKYIKSFDPYVNEEEVESLDQSENLQGLKDFTKNWFNSDAREWLQKLVKMTRERTIGHYNDKPDQFWWNPKEVEDWEYECAAALTASAIDQYKSEGKEAAIKSLEGYFGDTTLIGEKQSTKIHLLILHSSMIGFQNYFIYDCNFGGNESIKLTDEIVLKAFKIDTN